MQNSLRVLKQYIFPLMHWYLKNSMSNQVNHPIKQQQSFFHLLWLMAPLKMACRWQLTNWRPTSHYNQHWKLWRSSSNYLNGTTNRYWYFNCPKQSRHRVTATENLAEKVNLHYPQIIYASYKNMSMALVMMMIQQHINKQWSVTKKTCGTRQWWKNLIPRNKMVSGLLCNQHLIK